ncbi:SulP family inorganic anion transporter, partial [Enterococcus sp. 2CBP]
VAAYLVPQVMAYAVIAGLPAVVGLWSILLPMVIYFFLGTSRKLSIGPESTTALMTAAGVGALVGAAGGPERYAEVAAILAIAVGIVCLIGFVTRLGFLTSLLSRPVLIGYLIGIALLM